MSSELIQIPKLGKGPARFDKRTLRMARYLDADLPTPPVLQNWHAKVSSWPMMLNDTLGDCTCAAAGHMVEQWSTYSGSAFTPSDEEVLTMYEDPSVGNYNPNDPNSDQGANMLDVLNYWRNTPAALGGHPITAFASIEPGNDQEVKDSIFLTGNTYLGVQLPISVQGATHWAVPPGGPVGPGAPGSWGGHCIPLVGYGRLGLTCVSWGGLLTMSWAFLNTYADELYAVISPDWVAANMISPGGFNLTQLTADLAAL